MNTDMPPSSVTLSLSKGPPQSRPTAEAVVAAILFRDILKPLARGLGPVGEVALGSVADSLFVHGVQASRDGRDVRDR
jgi:hypothetical protein